MAWTFRIETKWNNHFELLENNVCVGYLDSEKGSKRLLAMANVVTHAMEALTHGPRDTGWEGLANAVAELLVEAPEDKP